MEKRLKDIELYEEYKRWSLPSGVFRCFFRATNFVSLKHYPDFELWETREESELEKDVLEVIDKYLNDRVLFILELSIVDLILCVTALNIKRHLNPILTFNNVLHSFGMIGGEEYISTLIGKSQFINYHHESGWVFAIDSDRFADYNEVDYIKMFNNQYELTTEDLPSTEMLKELRYGKVVHIGLSDLKEDLDSYFKYLDNSGIVVVTEIL